jgi:hypothetical protein
MAFKEIKSDVTFWKPTEPADEVIGVVVQEREHAEYGRSLILKTGEGKMIGLPAHSALQNLLREIKVGDRVKVTYLGEREGNNKRLFRDYAVFRDE